MLAAGYISTKAGGPKKAIFDKDAQEKIGKVQEVRHMHQDSPSPSHLLAVMRCCRVWHELAVKVDPVEGNAIL